MQDTDNDSALYVNIAALAVDPAVRAIVRRMALRAREVDGYLTVGSFIKDASKADLDAVLACGKDALTDQVARRSVFLMVALLANGEGWALPENGPVGICGKRFMWLTQAEQLAREGLVLIGYARASLETFDPSELTLTSKGQASGGIDWSEG